MLTVPPDSSIAAAPPSLPAPVAVAASDGFAHLLAEVAADTHTNADPPAQSIAEDNNTSTASQGPGADCPGALEAVDPATHAIVRSLEPPAPVALDGPVCEADGEKTPAGTASAATSPVWPTPAAEHAVCPASNGEGAAIDAAHPAKAGGRTTEVLVVADRVGSTEKSGGYGTQEGFAAAARAEETAAATGHTRARATSKRSGESASGLAKTEAPAALASRAASNEPHEESGEEHAVRSSRDIALAVPPVLVPTIAATTAEAPGQPSPALASTESMDNWLRAPSVARGFGGETTEASNTGSHGTSLNAQAASSVSLDADTLATSPPNAGGLPTPEPTPPAADPSGGIEQAVHATWPNSSPSQPAATATDFALGGRDPQERLAAPSSPPRMQPHDAGIVAATEGDAPENSVVGATATRDAASRALPVAPDLGLASQAGAPSGAVLQASSTGGGGATADTVSAAEQRRREFTVVRGNLLNRPLIRPEFARLAEVETGSDALGIESAVTGEPSKPRRAEETVFKASTETAWNQGSPFAAPASDLRVITFPDDSGSSAASVREFQASVDEVASQVVREARLHLRGTTGTVEMRLDPPVLGQVRLEVTLHDNTLIARLGTENAVAHRLLESQAEALRDALRASGINVASLEIGVGLHSGGSGAYQHAPREQAMAAPAPLGFEERVPASLPTEKRETNTRSGGVDFFA